MVRDSDGHGILAGSGRLWAVHDALSAEGEACLMALKTAMEVGISRVIIETDSLNLISNPIRIFRSRTSGSYLQGDSGGC